MPSMPFRQSAKKLPCLFVASSNAKQKAFWSPDAPAALTGGCAFIAQLPVHASLTTCSGQTARQTNRSAFVAQQLVHISPCNRHQTAPFECFKPTSVLFVPTYNHTLLLQLLSPQPRGTLTGHKNGSRFLAAHCDAQANNQAHAHHCA